MGLCARLGFLYYNQAMSSRTNFGNGFSLVGVLVAAGIMGFLALVFSQIITNSQKGQKSVENSIDFDILRSSIQLVLNKPSLCGAAFKNSDATDPIARFHPTSSIPTDKKLHSIFMGSSKIAEVGMKLGGGLEITKLDLEYIPPPAPPAPPPPPNSYEVNLIVEASKASGSYGGSKLSNASNPFRFSIQTNPSDEIVGCNSQSNFSEDCGSAGGGNGLICCQINSVNGVIACRHSNGTTWTSINSPFPNPAPSGKYSLSLIGMGPTPYVVCRGNSITGSVECRISNSVPANPIWSPLASPSFP